MATNRFFYPLRDPNHPSKVTLKPCSEEVYRAVMPDIWRWIKQMKARGLCCCPRNKVMLCDTDCALCEFRMFGNTVSLDAPISGDYELTRRDLLANDATAPDTIFEKVMVQIGLTQLDDLEYQVLVTLAWCKSEREAARELGMRRSTFKRRLDVARKHARKLLEDTP